VKGSFLVRNKLLLTILKRSAMIFTDIDNHYQLEP